MILVGQYDSPFVRRVAISLRVLGFAYRHDTRSVFGDFDAMRGVNPLGRIPSLILDWLDQAVGPQRALLAPFGPQRRRSLRLIALACGAIEKAGAAAYERLIRPAAYRWPEWIARCHTQAAGAVATLAAEDWPATDRLGQAEITAACMTRYMQMAVPELVPPSRYPSLDSLSARCEARPEFAATYPTAYAVPQST